MSVVKPVIRSVVEFVVSNVVTDGSIIFLLTNDAGSRLTDDGGHLIR